VEARETELLPTRYFHVVFTVPSSVGKLALQNKRAVYSILFRAASATLLEIAADPKHLGARIGALAVLHTWGQRLHHHPHLHCVVSGGGIAPDESRWVRSRKKFFLPVRVLSRLFRRKFLAYLLKAFESGRLSFHGRLSNLRDASAFWELLAEVRRNEWVVYAKRPFAGPQRVLRYLARYTHRVAISNQRLLSLDDGQVRFAFTDYANGNDHCVACVSAVEFLRRFLLHVLPKRFVRIRYYGFLANRARRQNLALARKLLGRQQARVFRDGRQTPARDRVVCPFCRSGQMSVVERVTPIRSTGAFGLAAAFDTS